MIETTPTGAIIVEGEKAIAVLRLASLAAGLKLEIRCPGLKMSRRLTALQAAKLTTGLKTNDRAKQLEVIEHLLEELKKQVTYVETVNPSTINPPKE